MDARTLNRINLRKQQKIRERQILLVVVPALLVIFALVLFLPRRGVVDASQLDQPTAQEMSRAPQSAAPVKNSSEVVQSPTASPMNLVTLNEITPDMVLQVQGGNNPMIEFRDGTRRSLVPSEVQQLPGEIRIRLEYSRDQR